MPRLTIQYFYVLIGAEGFEHDIQDADWDAQLGRHSLGWVSPR
ncbi:MULTISPECIES: hypothetical protein [unclassified Microbacterium]|nr:MULTISPECIES: hypothetical protein [unclassified Microbacterium]